MIMRIFFLEYQKMRYQMDRDAVLALLREQAMFAQYTPDQLTLDLQQLVKWKNLTPIQDPRKPRTIAEFKNKQYQYMMSQTAIEIERLTITLENLSTRTAGLSVSPFRRIREDLYRAEQLDEMPLREVNVGGLSAAEPEPPGLFAGVLRPGDGNADEIGRFHCL